MGLLSIHEAVVWWEYQHGKSTSDIFSEYEKPAPTPKHVLEVYEQLTDQKAKSDEDKEQEREKIQTTELKSAAYVSRVLSRAKEKIGKELRNHANSHRLDVETVLDEKGYLKGFDYQANTEVFIIFTLKLGVVVWYKHDSYAGKLCPDCPKEEECRQTLDSLMVEYDLTLRPDQEELYMTQQSIVIFNKLAAKEVPRYKRQEE
jgi:hypothetical protein